MTCHVDDCLFHDKREANNCTLWASGSPGFQRCYIRLCSMKPEMGSKTRENKNR